MSRLGPMHNEVAEVARPARLSRIAHPYGIAVLPIALETAMTINPVIGEIRDTLLSHASSFRTGRNRHQPPAETAGVSIVMLSTMTSAVAAACLCIGHLPAWLAGS
jgi:hypothetical protein